MKKVLSLPLALFVSWILLSGCGSSSPDSTAPDQSLPPSAAVTPFGIEAMSLPVDEDETVALDFTYNDAGELVTASLSDERDFNGDQRPDNIDTTVYTFDPDLAAQELPDLTLPGIAGSALPEVRLARVAGPILELPTSELPGTITQIDYTRYGYGDLFRASQIPEEMILEMRTTANYEYDEAGRLVTWVTESENPNEINTVTMSLSYDPSGRLSFVKSVRQTDRYKDGSLDSSQVEETTYAYDDNGFLSEKIVDDYADDDLEKTLYTHDESGNLTKQDSRRIDRADDILEDQEVTTYSYTPEGLMAEKVVVDYVLDSDGNYILDLDENPTLNSSTTSTYSYNDSGQLVEKYIEEDYDGDPAVIDNIYIQTYTYGEFGVTSFVNFERSSWVGEDTRTYKVTYNEAGQITELRYAWDDESDGIDYFDIETYTYDAEGRLTSVEEGDYEAVAEEPAATPNDKEQTAFSYDSQGRLTGWSYTDYDNGVDADYRISADMSYNADETGATGTIQEEQWDPEAAEGAGAMVAGDPRDLSFAFAAGAPTATLDWPIQTLPVNEAYDAEDFEQTTLNISVPALYGIGQGGLLFSGGAPLD